MRRPALSLLTPFRDRDDEARCVFPILANEACVRRGDVEVIALEVGERPRHERFLTDLGLRSIFIEDTGVFHKSRVLNLGLDAAVGTCVAPYDVDLIPARDTLNRLLQLSLVSDRILVAGYRLMSTLPAPATLAEIEAAPIEDATENRSTALRKALLRGERFGVVPAFSRARLVEIGGWDETFIGWGCEDQDVIERYLAGSRSFGMFPDLLYFHLHHGPSEGWAEEHHVARNRDYYLAKRERPQQL